MGEYNSNRGKYGGTPGDKVCIGYSKWLYNKYMPKSIQTNKPPKDGDKFNWGWINYMVDAYDQYSEGAIEAFAELYWFGELNPAPKPYPPIQGGSNCKDWSKTYDNCVNTLYKKYSDQPKLVANEMFNSDKYKGNGTKKLSSPWYKPLDPNNKEQKGMIATFSFEYLEGGNDGNNNCISSKYDPTWDKDKDSPKCEGKSGNDSCNKICGTFNGFSTFSYEKAIEFFNEAAKIMNPDDPSKSCVCLYEWQFVPLDWLNKSVSNHW